MGLYDLIDKDKIAPGLIPAQAQTTNFSDNVEASFQSTMDNFRINSKSSLIGEETAQRDAKYKELTGRNIYDDALPFLEGDTRLDSEKSNIPLQPHATNVRAAVDRLLDQSRKAGQFQDQQLLNSEGITKKAEDRARDSLAKQSVVAGGATRTQSIAGGLIGGFGAMPFDPMNVAGLAFGASASRSLLKTVFTEAAINAGQEAASQPFVKQWQNEIGEKYGFTDMAENVGMAAVFGAAIPVGVHALKLGVHGGVNAFDTIKSTFLKYGKLEAADSAEYMARVAHLEGSKTPNAELHTKAMNEANSAVLAGRPLNPELVDTPIPKTTDDPSMQSTIDKFNEPSFNPVMDSKAASELKLAKNFDEAFPDRSKADIEFTDRLRERGQLVEDPKDVNPLFREEKPTAPDIVAQEKIQEVHSSPEGISSEQARFEDVTKLPDDKPMEFNSDGEPTKTVADYKQEMMNDAEYLRIIKTCGI